MAIPFFLMIVRVMGNHSGMSLLKTLQIKSLVMGNYAWYYKQPERFMVNSLLRYYTIT